MALFSNDKKAQGFSSLFQGTVPIEQVRKEGERFLKDVTGQEYIDSQASIFAGMAQRKLEEDTARREKVQKTIAGMTGLGKQLAKPFTESTEPLFREAIELIPEERTVTSGLFGEIPIKKTLMSALPFFALGADIALPGPGEIKGMAKYGKKILERGAKRFLKKLEPLAQEARKIAAKGGTLEEFVKGRQGSFEWWRYYKNPTYIKREGSSQVLFREAPISEPKDVVALFRGKPRLEVDAPIIPITRYEADKLRDLFVEPSPGVGREAVARISILPEGEATGLEGWFLYDLSLKKPLKYGPKLQTIPTPDKEAVELFNVIRANRGNRIFKQEKNIQEGLSDFGMQIDRSQLTDIWNKAKKPALPVSLTQEAQILRGTKGMTAEDIMAKYPNIKLTKEVPATDIYGNKVKIPEGQALTPYELKGNKILLQDGETYIVSKNQFQNIKGQSVEAIGKPFAPELEGLEETVKGEGKLGAKDIIGAKLESNNLGEQRWVVEFNTGQKYISQVGTPKEQAILEAGQQGIRGKGITTKYSQYTLPGGRDYEEVLIRAPVAEDTLNKESIAFHKRIKEKYGISNAYDALDKGLLNDTERATLDRLSKSPSTRPDTFKSPHWDEPDVISHLRLNERTYNGKKVTFMEELQSDWARAGREKGFATDITKDTAKQQGFVVKKAKSSTGGEAYFIDNPKDEFFYRKGFTNAGFDTEAEAWDSIVKKLKETSGAIPFNKNLKNWQELSVKRGLQEAVNNDSEYFAWITGEQTSARYNLATQVDNVKWKVESTGEKLITIQPKDRFQHINILLDNKGNINYADLRTEWQGKKLDEVLGKGLADKIMEKESGTLSGEGLKFGGEWAENLYDKQVPNIVKDLTGARVEKLDMGLPIEKAGPTFLVPARGGIPTKILKPEDLRIGLNIEAKAVAGAGSYEEFVITDILGDGKFRAAPYSGRKQAFYPEELKTTFDISPKTTQQMGIKLTPEIKAKIRGESPKIETSGRMFDTAKRFPVEMLGVAPFIPSMFGERKREERILK